MAQYVLDFGTGATGLSPTFSCFKNFDTLANVTGPTITERGGGLYVFNWTWTDANERLVWKAVAGVLEIGDTSTSPTYVATATTRTLLDFGSANAGETPTFSLFVDTGGGPVLVAPAITEIEEGLYYFDWTWTSATATSIGYKATCNLVEQAGIITTTGVTSTLGVLPWAETAGSIINDAAVEVGLEPVDDPFNSTDANFVQLCRLLKSCGRDLARRYNWTHLTREYTFTTVAAQSTYALPSDFKAPVSETTWNRTAGYLGHGPMSPQEWQWVVSSGMALAYQVMFRRQAGVFVLYPPASVGSVTAGDTIAFEYISSWWCQPPGQVTPTTDAPSTSDDLIFFDPLLMVRALKVAWLKARNLPSNAAEVDYQERLEQCRTDDAPARTLSLDGTNGIVLGGFNVPSNGFGLP